MANYENGLDTKDHILQAAKELFYRKGYVGTTFKEISLLSKVNQGLIVYHFQNKASLANAVFRDYIKQSTRDIDREFSETDELTRDFLSDYLYFRLIFEDSNFRRFMNVCCKNGYLTKKNDAVNDETYLTYFWRMTDTMTEDMGPDSDLMESIIEVFEGVKNSYTCHICENYKRVNIREASENYIYIYCKLFGISEEHYGPPMMDAQILSNQVSVSIIDFEFEMTKVRTK